MWCAFDGQSLELEEVPMAIVGGLDVHRRQLTFDYVDTVTGVVVRGQVAPADRPHLAAWLARFVGVSDVSFAVEAGTGWRFVAEEMGRAGVRVELAQPADTAALRGKRRKAKTDRADAKLLRDNLAAGRIPGCYIPPAGVLECRALLEAYNDLRREHTAWVQRVHAVCFHHGVPALAAGQLSTDASRARVLAVVGAALTPAACTQVRLAAAMLDGLEEHLDGLRRELVARSRRMRGARMLMQTLYGVGPITALALVCWLGGAGRFSSSRQAVRFAGLDITVHSSDTKRGPGHLSRQGPSVLRWCLYEAGKTSARSSAPEHAYYAAVKERIDGKRAALAQARRIVRHACHLLQALGDDAFTLTTHTGPATMPAQATRVVAPAA
jgi:transposase